MAKKDMLFWTDIALLALLVATILSIATAIFTRSPLHAIFGLLLSGTALLHVTLHWNWIKNAFAHIYRLPAQARTNAVLDLALCCGYVLCLGMGLSAGAVQGSLMLHIRLGWFHAGLGLLVVTVQVVHIARHSKWLIATSRRMLTRSGHNHTHSRVAS